MLSGISFEKVFTSLFIEAVQRTTYRIDGYDMMELVTDDTERGFHVRGRL